MQRRTADAIARCAAILLVTLLASPATAEKLPVLKPLGSFTISTGFQHQGLPFGGLSALDYDPTTRRFIALSDDRSEFGPARFYELDIGLDQRGIARFEITRIQFLQSAPGISYPKDAVDPEGLRLLPDGRMLWSDEGTPTSPPQIVIANRDGVRRSALELPTYFMPDKARGRGIRDNLGHEGLAISSDGKRAIALTENALAQDGPIATPEAGTPARLTVFDLATGKPVSEHVYVTEPIPRASLRQPPVHDNGVSAAVTLPDGRLLVVERSFALGIGNTIQLFLVDLAGATDVLGKETIVDLPGLVPLKKLPILTLRTGENGQHIDNIEGAAIGPMVDGKPTLILVSDNNFNRRGQVTQFLAFMID